MFFPQHQDADVMQYAENQNLGFEEGRRQREEQQWAMKHSSMFPVFLACRVKTKAWANPQLALHDWKPACNCRVQRRKLDVLDTLSQYSFAVINLTPARFIDTKFLTLPPRS
jgi:hypothetical protein